MSRWRVNPFSRCTASTSSVRVSHGQQLKCVLYARCLNHCRQIVVNVAEAAEKSEDVVSVWTVHRAVAEAQKMNHVETCFENFRRVVLTCAGSTCFTESAAAVLLQCAEKWISSGMHCTGSDDSQYTCEFNNVGIEVSREPCDRNRCSNLVKSLISYA